MEAILQTTDPNVFFNVNRYIVILQSPVGNSARRVTRGNRRADAGGSQPLVILIWNYQS